MRRVLALGLAVSCVCLLNTHVRARQNPPPQTPDPVIDAQGLQQGRNYLSELPFERIDPLTGNVFLTFTDLDLPGNAGFNLQIVRAYNSKAPAGWTFGLAGYPYRIDNPQGTPSNPKLRMPDGGLVDSFFASAGVYRTKDFWQYNAATGRLQLTDGVEAFYSTTTGNLLNVRDVFGNQIIVTYRTNGTGEIEKLTQDLGNGRSREVTFGSGSLPGKVPPSMTLNGLRTWNYGFVGGRLVSVQPPVERNRGADWRYDYDPQISDVIKTVTTPNLGTVTYLFSTTTYIGGRYTRTLYQRTTGNVQVPGTWTYNYSDTFGLNTFVQGPDLATTTYTFGMPAGASEPVLLTVDRAALEKDERTYRFQAVTSGGGNAALLATRKITRGGLIYLTTNTYHDTDFSDYGRPYQVVELGENQNTRTTLFTFDYDFDAGRWIKDRVKGVSVQTSVPPNTDATPFVITRQFNNSTGFMESETRYGVTTSYTPTGRGNVQTMTDPHGHLYQYAYDWGVLTTTTTPLYVITRAINTIDGTVDSETRGAHTTQFDYDNIGRRILLTPPAGAGLPVSTVYHDNLVEDTRTDGSRTLITHTTLDGFGRATSTNRLGGVQTTTQYDVYGRLRFESLPFSGQMPVRGTTYTYDVLHRPKQVSRHGGHTITYNYETPHRVRITEVNQGADGTPITRDTIQQLASFGDPVEERVMSVTDADNKLWSYEYNGLGLLTKVSEPDGGIRTWAYEAGSDRLSMETRPESGAISYSYINGRLSTKGSPRGALTYDYDDNDRVKEIGHAQSAHKITMSYDPNDNRETLKNSFVNSTFTYDGANRLKTRTDKVTSDEGGPRGFAYDYNGFGELKKITYPSGNAVLYENYDNDSRARNVKREGATASLVQVLSYHPSGAIQSLQYGNNIVETSEFDANRYWLTRVSGGPVNLCYQYDRVGNVEEVKDFGQSVPANCELAGGPNSRRYRYDTLDRMKYIYNGATLVANYAYDASGNRRYNHSAGVEWKYFPAQRRVLVEGPQGYPGLGTFDFDTAGALATGPYVINGYTPFDMLETVQIPVIGQNIVYHYDGDNLKKERLGGGIQQYFFHGPANELLSEYARRDAGLPRWVRDYVYLNGRLVASMATPAMIAFTTTTSTADEKAPAVATATVKLITPDGEPLQSAASVQWTTVPGTAQPGSDYVSASNTVTFPAGSLNGATQNIQVNIVLDVVADGNISEPDETFQIQLSPGSAAVAAPSSHTVTIIDDEPWLVGYLDAPQSGTRYLPFTVVGWAIDRRATVQSGNTGIDVVRIYASPIGGGPPIPLGNATIEERTDVQGLYGSNFRMSGFRLRIPRSGPLTVGATYKISADVHFTRNDTWQSLPDVQAAQVTVQDGAVIAITSPTLSQPQKQGFTLRGYALDPGEVPGTGVDVVHVYAQPQPSGGLIFLGGATYGVSSPEAAGYGPRFANAGYTLNVGPLMAGTYQLQVYAHRPDIGWSLAVQNFTVQSMPSMTLDRPIHGAAIGQPFRLYGWAVDLAAISGTGVDTVHVWAFPWSGGQIWLGASYGTNRADVASIHGSQFTSSGFELPAVSGLAPDTYNIVAYMHSTVTGAFSHWVISTVTIPTPNALVNIDQPAPNAVVPQMFGLTGWAFDQNSPDTVGIQSVHVYAWPASGGAPTFVGVVPVMHGRADVAAAYQKPFIENCGWGVTVSLPPGTYTLVATPVSTGNRIVPGEVARVVTVQ